MKDKLKVFIIGRHAADVGEEFQVVGQKAVNFPAHSEECVGIINGLLEEAKKLEAALVFQALPAQATAAIARMRDRQEVGVIVSVPGPRPMGVVQKWTMSFDVDARVAAAIVAAVNPNVATTVNDNEIEVKVDPPMKFQYSHMEWL
jgi:predicted N-formylglutamate amidohydrolase